MSEKVAFGGVSKAHLDEVREDARRITLKRIQEQKEEQEYKAQKAEKKQAQAKKSSK